MCCDVNINLEPYAYYGTPINQFDKYVNCIYDIPFTPLFKTNPHVHFPESIDKLLLDIAPPGELYS